MRNLTYAYILVGELSGWTEAQPYIRSPYPASRAQAASLAMTGITEEPDLRLKRRYNTLRELYSQKDSYDQETKAIPADTV